jgi:hypothetical protein
MSHSLHKCVSSMTCPQTTNQYKEVLEYWIRRTRVDSCFHVRYLSILYTHPLTVGWSSVEYHLLLLSGIIERTQLNSTRGCTTASVKRGIAGHVRHPYRYFRIHSKHFFHANGLPESTSTVVRLRTEKMVVFLHQS